MKKIIFVFLISLEALAGLSQTDLNKLSESVLSHQKVPLIVGHRGGYEADLPENSLSLFDYTYNNSCRNHIAVEFDIKQSASGSLFVLHDSTVDRTTNGSGRISQLTDSYINTLFLKDANGNITKDRIPLFSDVLKHFKDKNVMLMLDVKGKICSEVISIVEDIKMESKCIILTFNQSNTRFVKETTDKILISALVRNKTEWESLLKLHIPSQQLLAYVNKETPLDLINEICQSEVKVMTDMSENIFNNSQHFEPEYYRNFLTKMKLEIMITDYPVYVNKLFCKD